jgi:lipoprotein-anchoring transpeptidase ErfK/SrfK
MTRITSSTNPIPTKTYHNSTVQFSWQGADAGSGIAGYSYRLDTDPKGQARAEVRTNGTNVTLNGLSTGTYYFHVRALDRVGNWGSSSTFPVRIDVTPPGLSDVTFSRFQLDPQFDNLSVSFAVTRAAHTVRVGVYRQNTGTLVRLYTLSGLRKGQKADVAWDGKNTAGQYAPAGLYSVYIRAIDKYGHSKVTGWNDFALDYKRVLVSLSQQKLWAYDGNKVVLTSLVTTGNRALPTPTGTYHIMAKLHPFTFHSPWPKSSPFYYAPSKVAYAMLFREGGYFIHDAPWRTAFGPGTNSQLGTPGSNYTGTHGCVNVPANVARELFSWTQIGTVVQVVP